MKEEKIFIVSYDIAAPKRWRGVFNTLKGYGEWIQLSVFQCRMDDQKRERLISDLDEIIKADEDHILFIDIGKPDKLKTKIYSLGKTFKTPERKAFVF